MYHEYKNTSIYYEKHGNSKDVILILPGWGNTRNTFSSIINYLKNNYTIYILDYPSFGKSSILNTTYTIYDYALMILDFLNTNKIINPIIIAHSFGGRITAILVGKYNYLVKRIILIDVAGIKHFNIKIFFKTYLYKLLNKISILIKPLKRLEYKNNLLKMFASSDYQNISNSMKKTFQNIVNTDLREYYKKINNKALLLWGEYDKDTPLKDAYLLKKYIKNSELIIFSKASHYSYLDYSYETILIINEYLKGS